MTWSISPVMICSPASARAACRRCLIRAMTDENDGMDGVLMGRAFAETCHHVFVQTGAKSIVRIQTEAISISGLAIYPPFLVV